MEIKGTDFWFNNLYIIYKITEKILFFCGILRVVRKIQ